MTPADAREPFVRYEQDGRIVTLTLNRPEARNAIATHEDCEELAGAFERANDDPAVSCLILTGAGSAFSAGGNIKAMKERNGIGRSTPPTPLAPTTSAAFSASPGRCGRARFRPSPP